MKEPSAIEKAQVSNIIKKAKAGKVLSAREEAIVKKYEQSQKPKEPENQYDTDNTGIAFFFGVSSKTVCEWVRSGAPKESYGVYNLKKFFDWWIEEIDEGGNSDDPTLTALRAEGQKIKNDRERMKRDTERGLLIPKSEIKTEWSKLFGEFRQSALSLPVKLAQLLEGKTQDEIRATAKEFIFKMLENLSRPQRYFKPQRGKRNAVQP